MNNPIWNKIKQLFFDSKEKDSHASPSSKEKLSFFHWLVIIACVGLAAMILHNFFSIQKDLSPTSLQPLEEEQVNSTLGSARSSSTSMEENEEKIENQLQEILSKIVGVGEVAVMLTLDSTEQLVIEKNKRNTNSKTNEKAREGGNRTIEDSSHEEEVVIIRSGNDEKPVIVTTKQPQVRGIVVVANGADNLQVKTWIIEAVQRVLDVPAHKISVVPKRK